MSALLWIQETSRCRKNRSSCWTEFGQAVSMLNGKFELLTLNRMAADRLRGVPIHLARRLAELAPPFDC
jgi:hypothetical protein